MTNEELAEIGRSAHQAIAKGHSDRTCGKTFASFEDAKNRAWLATAVAIRVAVEANPSAEFLQGFRTRCTLLKAFHEVTKEVERLTRLADDLNEAAKGAFLDGRKNAFSEAVQIAYSIGKKHDISGQEFDAAGAYEVMTAIESAEAMRPVSAANTVKWVIHILGPDDVIDQPDELTALQEANKLNIGMARRRAEDPSDNDPHCWAVVKDASVGSV